MNYFDENNEVVDLDKKIFEENYSKQMKITKRIFLIFGIVFSCLGILFLIALLTTTPEVAFAAIPFGFMGILFTILGLSLPEKGNYESYKKRINKGGYLNLYEMQTRMAILEKKNENLESKVKELEDKIRKLK